MIAGKMTADLSDGGTRPLESDVFTMSVMAGSIGSIQLFSNQVGIGSSCEVLDGDLIIILATASAVTGENESNALEHGVTV